MKRHLHPIFTLSSWWIRSWISFGCFIHDFACFCLHIILLHIHIYASMYMYVCVMYCWFSVLITSKDVNVKMVAVDEVWYWFIWQSPLRLREIGYFCLILVLFYLHLKKFLRFYFMHIGCAIALSNHF